MRPRTLRRPVLAVLLCVAMAVAAPPVRAESGDSASLSPGALVEASDLVVVALVEGEPSRDGERAEWTFRVVRVVMGAADADAPVRVVTTAKRLPFARGAEHLLFLRKAEDGRLELTAPRHGARCLAEPGVGPVAAYAEAYASHLGPDRKVREPVRLAALLASSVAVGEPGVPGAAAIDLLRHDELISEITDEGRAGITAALGRDRKPDEDLAGVILAAGAAGGPGADRALVARLLDPSVRNLRRHIGDALARRARDGHGEAIARMLVAELPERGAADRAELAFAMGRIERPETEPALSSLVREDEPSVRIEAAHALGLLARAVRAPRPDAAGGVAAAERPKLSAAREPLLAALARSKTRNERKAVLWALGQIDTQEAWADLRRIAGEDGEPVLRDLAADVLMRPRTALLLDE